MNKRQAEAKIKKLLGKPVQLRRGKDRHYVAVDVADPNARGGWQHVETAWSLALGDGWALLVRRVELYVENEKRRALPLPELAEPQRFTGKPHLSVVSHAAELSKSTPTPEGLRTLSLHDLAERQGFKLGSGKARLSIAERLAVDASKRKRTPAEEFVLTGQLPKEPTR